ncbi:MAG: hypothetical protein RIA08_01935 [Roseovarius sp.]|uniref:hypothetical protein n=1 Tax=Roseovarius sp. TaxID=1486281 RepID=UPI0032EAAF1D
MQRSLRYLLISAGIAFLVLAGLSFTPLDVFPAIFTLVVSSWEGMVIGLFLFGMPFGGYVLMLTTNHPRKWLNEAAGLTGFWIGATCGSLTGLKLAGTL